MRPRAVINSHMGAVPPKLCGAAPVVVCSLPDDNGFAVALEKAKSVCRRFGQGDVHARPLCFLGKGFVYDFRPVADAVRPAFPVVSSPWKESLWPSCIWLRYTRLMESNPVPVSRVQPGVRNRKRAKRQEGIVCFI